MADVSCDGKMSREINREIKRLIARGETQINVREPGARHNLGVAILESVDLTFDGSVGYYCAGMIGCWSIVIPQCVNHQPDVRTGPILDSLNVAYVFIDSES